MTHPVYPDIFVKRLACSKFALYEGDVHPAPGLPMHGVHLRSFRTESDAIGWSRLHRPEKPIYRIQIDGVRRLTLPTS